jgi:hypothetical protein
MNKIAKRIERVKPIDTQERKTPTSAGPNREERLRRRYRAIHCKVVDWVDYYTVEDGSLYISVRFKDNTDFSLCFFPRIITDRVELCDSTTEDFEIIQLYEEQPIG